MKKRRKIRPGQILLNLGISLLGLAVLAPFILLVSISLSNETDIARNGYSFIPRQIDFSAYEYVFKNATSVINAYEVTIFISLVTMVLSVLFMALIAYPLSKRTYKAKKPLSFYLYFTMLFSGGMVPSYILMTQYLHLGNTIWVYIIPSLMNPWYVFMMRTFFAGIPVEMMESASIDGAGEYRILFRIVLPLSKPVLATVALFTFLNKWNDWYTAMLYIQDDKLVSLQYLLQRIMLNMQMLRNSTMDISSFMSTSDIPMETARMAMAIVVAGPALLVFPFFQKYFVRGLTVGGVKG